MPTLADQKLLNHCKVSRRSRYHVEIRFKDCSTPLMTLVTDVMQL